METTTTERSATTNAVEPHRLREVMSKFATGVTVITAVVDAEPIGMAVNSFTSVSLDPPLVLFCAGKSSSTWPQLRRAEGISVNLLGYEQQELSHQFASKSGDRFDGVDYVPGATGAPVLAGTIGHLDCVIEDEHDAGDHIIVVARVMDLDTIAGHADPLVFFQGGYHQLAS